MSINNLTEKYIYDLLDYLSYSDNDLEDVQHISDDDLIENLYTSISKYLYQSPKEIISTRYIKYSSQTFSFPIDLLFKLNKVFKKLNCVVENGQVFHRYNRNGVIVYEDDSLILKFGKLDFNMLQKHHVCNICKSTSNNGFWMNSLVYKYDYNTYGVQPLSSHHNYCPMFDNINMSSFIGIKTMKELNIIFSSSNKTYINSAISIPSILLDRKYGDYTENKPFIDINISDIIDWLDKYVDAIQEKLLPLTHRQI